MGNSSSNTITGGLKIHEGPKPEFSGQLGSDASVSDSESSRTNSAFIRENPKENISGTSEGLVNNLRDERQSHSFSNTSENNHRNPVEIFSGSPHIRRNVVRRNSVHLSGRPKDCSRGGVNYHVGYEPAAVTLEPLEHEWMMCTSDGQWDSLHRLLASDPTLLTKKDFVTGFTCLHWAAKLGKHELIAMLVSFAKDQKVAMNINARSSGGYTPLHLAAMHNHTEVVKLLVGAFDADVEARDYNGKKAGQYLKTDNAQNILDIVGAYDENDAEVANRWRLSRVIQANFIPIKQQTHTTKEEDACKSGLLIKQKSIRRKSSFTRIKPSFHKIRLSSQIVHSASLLDTEEGTGDCPNPSRL